MHSCIYLTTNYKKQNLKIIHKCSRNIVPDVQQSGPLAPARRPSCRRASMRTTRATFQTRPSSPWLVSQSESIPSAVPKCTVKNNPPVAPLVLVPSIYQSTVTYCNTDRYPVKSYYTGTGTDHCIRIITCTASCPLYSGTCKFVCHAQDFDLASIAGE